MSGISTSIHHVKNITATNEYLSGTVCHYTSIEVEQEDGNILSFTLFPSDKAEQLNVTSIKGSSIIWTKEYTMATKYEYQGGKYTLEKIIKMYLQTTDRGFNCMEECQGDIFVSDLNTLIQTRCDLKNLIVQIERIKKEKKTSKVAYQYDNDDRLDTSISLDDASVTRFKSLDEEGAIGINDLKIPDRY